MANGGLESMNTEEFFFQHRVFRQDEFVAFRNKDGNANLPSIKQLLHYYIKTKQLVSIKRGMYASLSPTETPETASIDPYLIAANTTSNSVLAYHTALELHGVAYSSFNDFLFLTHGKVKPFDYNNQHFQPVVTKDKKEFGIETIERQGMKIKITNLTRTFVDILNRPELSGGWEEVCRSVENINILNIDEAIKYCLKLNNNVLAAKVGFFLERRQGAFTVDAKDLQHLQTKKPKWPQYVKNLTNEKYYFIKKWNLMMPETIIGKTWEEPDYDR